jgi:GNAT superfamily N-acetyltransferase
MTTSTFQTTSRPPTVTRATAADLDTVAGVLAEAFHDDPVFRWCLPDPARRAEILPGFFGLVASALHIYDDIHLSPSGGAALWVPAGEPPVPEDEAAAFESGMADLLGGDGERVVAIDELLSTHHPAQPNHYLWFIGVRPGAQGGGVGTTLLTSRLARCDREGFPAYLDATSEQNRRLYERHGFVVLDELTVADSPPIWPMWRTPAAVGSGTRSGEAF